MAGPPDSEKALITAACQRFIDEVLKPRFPDNLGEEFDAPFVRLASLIKSTCPTAR